MKVDYMNNCRKHLLRNLAVCFCILFFVGGLQAVESITTAEINSGLFPIFAFDNYMSSGQYRQPQVRADTLKELGYEGMSYHGIKGIMETIEIFEKAGLKLFVTYLRVNLDVDQKYDPNLKTTIKQLNGKETMLWL